MSTTPTGNISQVQLPDGNVYTVKDTVSGYVTLGDVPAISVNTTTKSLVITTSVSNGDEVSY